MRPLLTHDFFGGNAYIRAHFIDEDIPVGNISLILDRSHQI